MRPRVHYASPTNTCAAPKTFTTPLCTCAREHEVILELAEIVLRGEHEPARDHSPNPGSGSTACAPRPTAPLSPAADRGLAKNLQFCALGSPWWPSCGLWEPTLSCPRPHQADMGIATLR